MIQFAFMKKLLLVFAVQLLLFSCLPGYARHFNAPDHIITGKITNEKGDPLDNATVQVKGSRTSTKTKSDGSYSISVPNDSAVLVFSFVGMAKQEINVGGKSTLDVKLSTTDTSLDEVIVVGYGTQKRSHLTGAVATVEMKSIQDIPAGNLAEAIKGQMPGVQVSGGYSRPGQPATISVRNPIFFSKDGGSTNPLYIIDDIMREPNDFALLDATEVESITVLKDAAAAIYGIRGANGVIIVKTKRGKSGQAAISYSGSYGITDAVAKPKMMSGYQQAIYLNDLNYAAGKNADDPSIYTADELAYFQAHDYNWLDMAWKKASQMRQTINVSGGSDKATYFAGLTYNTQDGNFSGTRYNRYTFRASSDIRVANGLKLGLSLSGSLDENKQVFSKQGGEALDNDWKTLTTTSRFNPPYVDGKPVLLTTATNSTIDNYHFFAIQNSGNFTQTKNTGLNFQGQLSYEVPFIKGLKAALNFNKNLANTFGKQYGTKYNVYEFSMLGDHKHIYGGTVNRTIQLNNGDRVRISPGYTDVYQLNGVLTYDRRFGKHQITVLAAYEQSETSTDQVNAMREGVIVGGLPNMNYATGTNTTDETQSESGRLAYIGRVNYNYAGKYLAELTYRGDASANFAPQNRWGYFPSLSLGWVISEEGFFRRNVKSVDYLKLRGSVGLLGSDNTRAYQYLVNYVIQTGKAPVFGGNQDRGLAVLANTAIANGGIKWDSDTKINGGIDTRFLDNRLSVSVDGFFDHRYNQLASLTSSVSLLIGAAVPPENYAKTNSFGYEISATWKDKINKDWSYNVNAFLSWSDNKVLIADVPVGNLGTYLDQTGRSSDMGVLGYRYAGMFRTQAQVDEYLVAHPGYTIFGAAPKPGMLNYQDVRGPKVDGVYTKPDGKITADDLDYIAPKSSNHYAGGINWGVTYKTVSLNVLMNYSFGGKAAVESGARTQGTATSNRPEFWADHWTPDNPNASMPSPYYKDNYNVASDFWLKNGFTFGVTNLNLSYAVPSQWTKKAGLNGGARVFFIATNPFNFYNPFSYRSNLSNYDAYPVLKGYSLGLNLGF
ncbi:TonB-dependent receptor [Filimonas lacunae]|nr:TonB-dependent receptor [Filimonas lacunae]